MAAMTDGGWSPTTPEAALDLIRFAASRLRGSATSVQAVTDRAAERRAIDGRSGYFFALVGLKLADDESRLYGQDEEVGRRPLSPEGILGRRGYQLDVVDNAPGITHLAVALKESQRQEFATFGAITNAITHELYVAGSNAPSLQAALNNAYHWLWVLRIKTRCFFRVVAVSNSSWNQMAAATGDVEIWPLELSTSARLLIPSDEVTLDDVIWSFVASAQTFGLYSNPRFRLAFEAAATASFESDSRTAIARVWAGVEAVLDVQYELAYRISTYGALLIEDEPTARLAAKKSIERLYRKRGKAVHGVDMSSAEMYQTLSESWSLLQRVLLKCVAMNRVPTPKDLDALTLQGPAFGPGDVGSVETDRSEGTD
jgi:hypothetical protein